MAAGIACHLRVKILGPVRAWLNAQELTVGPPQQRAALATLAVRAGQVVTRDELIDAIWGERPPRTAAHAIHVYIGRLRQVIEPAQADAKRDDVLTSSGPGYVLRLRPDQVDACVFRRQLERAQELQSADELRTSVEALEAALSLWSGTPMTGLSAPFALAERARLTELRLSAVETRAEILLGLGSPGGLVGDLAALVAENPFREKLTGLLMLALYREGRQNEALTVYQRTRRLLIDELGVEPGEGLRKLHQQMLAADPELSQCASPLCGEPRDEMPKSRLNPGQHASAAKAQQTAGVPHQVPTELKARVASTAALTTPRQLPAPPRYFTGRALETNKLDDLLAGDVGTPEGAVVISAVGGTAGVGKTALAIHWAHRVAARFPDGQLHANLRGFGPGEQAAEPAEVIRAFLDALGVPAARIPVSIDAQAALYRSLLSGRRMLIVLDNARESAQVRPLLPGSPGCLVVITSRNQLIGLVADQGAHPVTLGLLTQQDARELLARRLGAERIESEPDATDELITVAAGLPLALNVIAARAAVQPDPRLAALASELRACSSRLSVLATGDPATDIRAVFSQSHQNLSAGAARMFRLLGLHPGPDISLSAAASLAGISADEARQALAELIRAHLISVPAPGRYSQHDLLRAYAAELAKAMDTDASRRAIHRMLDHYLYTGHSAVLLISPGRRPIISDPPQPGVLPEDISSESAAMDWFRREHRVLLAAVTTAADYGFCAHAWKIPWSLMHFLTRKGYWHDLETIQRVALEAATRSGDVAGQAYAYRYLGNARGWLGFHDEAISFHEKALELFHRLGDLVSEAQVCNAIAYTMERVGRPQDALPHIVRGRDLLIAAGDELGQARSFNALGWCHALLGNQREALTFCQQGLDLCRNLGDRVWEAATLDSLGHIHRELGNYAQALDHYRQALDLFRDLGDQYYQAGALAGLGETYRMLEDRDAADNAWRTALSILEELGHPDADQIRAKLDDLETSAARPPR